MIYEHRSYTLLPGKKGEFLEWFRKFIPLMEKNGAKVVGAWQTVVGESNEFIYILGFDDFAKREAFWEKVHKEEVFVAYQKRGPFTANATNKILRPL